jgi:hypothetical protein
MKNGNLRILLVGDAVGLPGRMMFQKYSHSLKQDYDLDAIIVNGENSGSAVEELVLALCIFSSITVPML